MDRKNIIIVEERKSFFTGDDGLRAGDLEIFLFCIFFFLVVFGIAMNFFFAEMAAKVIIIIIG